MPRARPGPRPAGPDADFVRWFLAHAGVGPDVYRLPALLRRVPACLRALHARSTAAARELICANPALVNVAADSFFIGVTAFYRDPPVFDTFRCAVLPRLARRSTLAVWSVGCSSGAELYTIACMLADAGLLGRSHLIGTDLRRNALSQAAAGLVTPQHAAGIPPVWRERYFTARDGLVMASPELRGSIRWLCSDAFGTAPPAPGRFDLVLCRNVAVYIETPAAAALWMSLAAAMAPGGCLLTGRAEKPAVATLARLAPSVYLKQEA